MRIHSGNLWQLQSQDQKEFLVLSAPSSFQQELARIPQVTIHRQIELDAKIASTSRLHVASVVYAPAGSCTARTLTIDADRPCCAFGVRNSSTRADKFATVAGRLDASSFAFSARIEAPIVLFTFLSVLAAGSRIGVHGTYVNPCGLSLFSRPHTTQWRKPDGNQCKNLS